MNTPKLFKSLVVFVLLANLLGGCKAGPTNVDVTLATYSLTLSANTARAGTVIFHVTNTATDQKHEFVIFKTDLPEDQLPLTPDGNVDEEGAGVTHIDEVGDMDPGTSQDLTVVLEPGTYVVICNLTDNALHYQQGMHQVFTVK